MPGWHHSPLLRNLRELHCFSSASDAHSSGHQLPCGTLPTGRFGVLVWEEASMRGRPVTVLPVASANAQHDMEVGFPLAGLLFAPPQHHLVPAAACKLTALLILPGQRSDASGGPCPRGPSPAGAAGQAAAAARAAAELRMGPGDVEPIAAPPHTIAALHFCYLSSLCKFVSRLALCHHLATRWPASQQQRDVGMHSAGRAPRGSGRGGGTGRTAPQLHALFMSIKGI